MAKKIKTLVVEYTPRGELSLTKKLRNHFTDLIADRAEIEFVDLAKNPPKVFDDKALMAYYNRAYLKKDLSPEEQEMLIEADAYRDQMMNTEVLVISCPMYNFGFPGAMKVWLDSVMQKGHVYHHGEEGHLPALGHLKVAIIYTAGILFDQVGDNEEWNGIETSYANLFRFMGAAEVRPVSVQGVDTLPVKNVRFRIERVAKGKLNELAIDWYGIERHPGMPLYSELRNPLFGNEPVALTSLHTN